MYAAELSLDQTLQDQAMLGSDAPSLPELAVTSQMRVAAQSVAKSFHAFQAICYSLPQAKKEGKVSDNLRLQREFKQAYHLALSFLAMATLKANPAYDLTAYKELSDIKREEAKELIYSYLNKQLNQLIAEEAATDTAITNQWDAHPVMEGPW